MHLHFTDTESGTIDVEDNIVVFAEQAHRDGAVGDFLGDHEGGQPHTEGVVVVAGMPDGNLFGLPGLDRTDGHGAGGHVLDGTAAGGTGILDQSDRVQIDQTGSELAVFGRGRRVVFVLAVTTDGVVERQCLVSP